MSFDFTFMLILDSWLLDEEETEPIVTIPTPQNSAWIQDWNNHMESVSILVLVPAPARQIHTPLVKPKWAGTPNISTEIFG